MQLTPLDVDYHREEQAKTRGRLDELKKPKVIPREKPLANFSFKPLAFDLISPIQLVPYASENSSMGFERFIGRNPFDLHINPFTFSSSYSYLFSTLF